MIIYGTSKIGRIYRNVQPLAIAQKSEATRVCRLCGKEKPMTAYAKAKHLKSGRAYECKECARAAYKEKYGKAAISNRTPVTIKDLETSVESSYPSATAAAKAIGCDKSMVRDRVRGRRKSPIRGRFEVQTAEVEAGDVRSS